MEQNSSKSLVSPSNSGALEKAGSRPRRILSLMMTDALVLARKKERALTQPRHWIGDQELRDADYRQILNWAEALGMAPRRRAGNTSHGRDVSCCSILRGFQGDAIRHHAFC